MHVPSNWHQDHCMPIKLRLRQCPLLRIVPMKKEGHMIWVVNGCVVWGFCCAAADHKNLFSFLHTILLYPPVCVWMYVTWLIVNLSLCHVQFIVRYICLGCEKKEPPMDTRCEKDQAQNRTNYFSATSTVANRVTALAKNRVAGRFENGLSFLQRKGKGCLVGKQRIQWQNYFLPSEKGLRCGKQRHYLVIWKLAITQKLLFQIINFVGIRHWIWTSDATH